MRAIAEDDDIERPATVNGQPHDCQDADQNEDESEEPVRGPDPVYQRITEAAMREAREESARQQPQPVARLAEPQAAPGSAGPPPPDLVAAGKAAQKIDELSGAAFLYGLLGKMYPGADLLPFKLYLNGLVELTGIPTDPIERMLVEQAALAHFAIGLLILRAGTRENLDEVSACHAAAARLMGEFRRHALALQEYRAAAAKKKKARPKSRPAAVKSKPEKNGKATNGARLNGAKKVCDSEVVSNGRLTEFFDERKPEPALA